MTSRHDASAHSVSASFKLLDEHGSGLAVPEGTSIVLNSESAPGSTHWRESMARRSALRELARTPGPVRIPLVWDAVSAQLAAQVGAEALFVTGFGSAAAQGLPDIGLMNQTEAIGHAARIASSVDVPVIVDADDGFGSLINLARTISLIAESKISGLVIEDQPFPKRSNLLGVHAVIPLEDALERVSLAVQLCSQDGLWLAARTDSATVNGSKDALARATAFAKAGVDAVFVTDLGLPEAQAYGQTSPEVPKLWLGAELSDEEATQHGIQFILTSRAMHSAWRSFAVAAAGEQGYREDVDHRALLRRAQRIEAWDAIASRHSHPS